jgi:hypothetical protein
MLLVAALGLAVAFVALALVLNAVVFTENLATRNPDPADDALAYEGAVTQGVGGLLAETNRHDDTDYGTLDGAFRTGVVAWDANASRLVAADGTLTTVELASTNNGTRIVQNADGNFTDDAGNESWTLAGAVSDTRRFVVVADPEAGGTFTVEVSNGNESWRVEVDEDGSGNAAVTVYESGSPVATVDHDDDTVAVDLTEGTVNGSVVEDFTFAAGVTPSYNVTVTDGSAATGRYQLFVDEQQGDFDTDAPTTRPAIYSAVVDVTVHRSSVTYESPVVLAPGDAPGNSTLAQ